MISIITAVYNQLDINKLYYHHLKKYTQNPFELIIIDNASTDGSCEFFESVGATVIKNEANYSYPHSQNQGIAIAKYSLLAFLNNDIIVSPNWDQRFIETMRVNGLDVITSCGIEEIETPQATRRLTRRWKKIKNLLNTLWPFRGKYALMHRLMYGNWERFSEARYQRFKHQIKPGFVGNTVLMTRNAIEKLGLFDERIQGADFDLCLRSREYAEQHTDMKPIHIALDIFIHHFIRITLKSKPPRFVDADQFIELKEKWKDKSIQL
jgi:GT2 family glycosyltransferase